MTRTDGVTLRGESGHRDRVVLDGAGTLGEVIALRACSGVTVADLTVQNVRWNGIKLDSERASSGRPSATASCTTSGSARSRG